VKRIQVCSNKVPRVIVGFPHPRGLNFYIVIYRGKCLKNLLLNNHWGNFNQSWQEKGLEDGDSDLFK